MNVIGALKKSNTDATIYFYEYEPSFNWEEIVNLFETCCCTQEVSEDDISCLAVEVHDKTQSEKLVGMTFHNGSRCTNLVTENYDDLDFYLNDLSKLIFKGR